MTAQQYANNEGITYVRIPAGTCIRGVICPVSYCIRAREARIWEMLAGQIVFPTGGERYDPPHLPPSVAWEPYFIDYDGHI